MDPNKLMGPDFEMTTIQVGGSPYEEMSTFYSNATLTALKETPDQCEWKFERVVGNLRDGNTKDYVELEFQVTYEKDGKTVEAPLVIRMLREVHNQPYGVQWAVDFVL